MGDALARFAGEALPLLAVLGVGLALYLGLLIASTAWRLTHPPRRTYASAVARNLPGDPSELDVPLAFDQTEIAVVWGRSTACVGVWRIAGANPDGPTVVLTPGWGDSRVGALARVRAFAPGAREVICWDPPGLGDSAGTCALGVREPAALADLIDRLDVDGPIVLAGWSMGGGVSIAAAHDDRVRAQMAGVIAEAPYAAPITPARNVLHGARLPWRLNLRPALWVIGLLHGVGPSFRGFDRVAHARELGDIPLLVLHGSDDLVCPASDGRAIADAAPTGELSLVDGGGHNDLWTDLAHREASANAIARFVRAVWAASPTTMHA